VQAVPAREREFLNSIGMTLVSIPAGSFLMGSEENSDEKPPHRVSIGRPFLMAAHKTTQAQFGKVLVCKPSYFSSAGGGRDKVAGFDTALFPVETVTYFDAVEFCVKLSESASLTPCYRLFGVQRDSDGCSIKAAQVDVVRDGTGYRLPT